MRPSSLSVVSLKVHLFAYWTRRASLIWVKAPTPPRVYSLFMTEQPLIDIKQEKIIALDKETQFAPNGIVSRTVLNGPTTRVILFGFSQGQELTEHTSTQHAL